jgi:hypothetical protein
VLHAHQSTFQETLVITLLLHFTTRTFLLFRGDVLMQQTLAFTIKNNCDAGIQFLPTVCYEKLVQPNYFIDTIVLMK